ncbi:MAG: M15 family metallopeptidase [Deltaproteobacteria bacterium]|nr:M15 family metallopeptidase [Deltaproteobacteria bacterium]
MNPFTKMLAMGLFLSAFTGMSMTPNWAAANPFGPDYVEITANDVIALDIRYATTHNFTGRNVYGTHNTCFLHQQAAAKLFRAAELLRTYSPGYKLLVFDCLRPRSVQRLFWGVVKGTPQQPYVANPDKGSLHNFGFAVDLSLLGPDGHELDMGTPFDAFTEAAQPKLETKLLAKGVLTQPQLERRMILRRVMTEAGFLQLPNEWWHYDALDGKTVRKNYRIVE